VNLLLIAILLALMAVGYRLGTRRSRKVSAERKQRLHSLPQHYGTLVALWCGIPAFIVLVLWMATQSGYLESVALSELPAAIQTADEGTKLAAVTRVMAIADGTGVVGEIAAEEQAAADAVGQARLIRTLAAIALAAALAIGGFLFTLRRITPKLQARDQIEFVVRVLLFVSSLIAILTTVGIVLSMLTEAIRFFTFVSPIDFFFGTEWRPTFSSTGSGGAGEYGLLPLLLGTLLVSVIAMLFAIPVGLMTAIYLANYASPRLRATAKPIIEILAGIPTIVYGFFALVTVGPALHAFGEWVSSWSFLGIDFELDINATSALTAGLVMGIMIIPFISSIADDIITQVPRSLRDGSLGLGATKSETIRRVILPAALPGIVGAFLLAVSRAIGETMIVVLAAGNSPVLQGNPLEAVSTVTVTIVNQLTGDTDFASPQSLVAFALGLTLFVMTLALNIVALYIVRKYREQYD
jgi:phosphate transport system permease protein